MTGRMLQALDEIFIREKPDGVLVYGDTNSTLAGALSAAKLHIPVIHIEAGLRSYNKKMPEEINRILTDHVSSLLFCPTQTAVSNLTKEGVTKNVHWVGDVMYDATRYAIEQVKNLPLLGEKFSFLPKNFIFMTVHREESTSSLETFSKLIGYAIDFCAPSISIVFPLHPRTRPLVDQLPHYLKEKIFFTPPLSYLETQWLLTKAHYVLTDSGGLQKEAYFHQVPCITLRSETEWVETVEAGWNQLWTQPYKKSLSKKPIDDYGAGNASGIIMNIISDFLE